jgi:hypothetical protein
MKHQPIKTLPTTNWKTSMHSKSLLIAIAALALTATGAQAFTGETLLQAGLTESQLAAFEVARELRAEGDQAGARDILVEAGIDETIIERVRSVLSADHRAKHDAMHAALEAGDYEAFLTAVVDSPLADIITTEADFKQFKEAHELKTAGDQAGAASIFRDLGLPESPTRRGGSHHGHNGGIDSLSDDQKAAFEVAKTANDRETMQAIMVEAGMSRDEHGFNPKFLRDGRELDN